MRGSPKIGTFLLSTEKLKSNCIGDGMGKDEKLLYSKEKISQSL
jgi:hypothetical protein